jgi:hypothetical protein
MIVNGLTVPLPVALQLDWMLALLDVHGIQKCCAIKIRRITI